MEYGLANSMDVLGNLTVPKSQYRQAQAFKVCRSSGIVGEVRRVLTAIQFDD